MDELIHKAMMNVMRDIEAISKEQTNKGQGYKFRGIDDLYNAVHPLFKKHGIYITPKVLNALREERRNDKGTILIWSIIDNEFTFRAEDGSSVSCVVRGEAMDSGDKATNKASSASLKYALMQMFLIPIEDMKDADLESHAPLSKKIEEVKEKLTKCNSRDEFEMLWETLSKAEKSDINILNLFKQSKWSK